MHSLDFGDISGSDIDFEPKGIWGNFETAGGGIFGGKVFWGETLIVALEEAVVSTGASGFRGGGVSFSGLDLSQT